MTNWSEVFTIYDTLMLILVFFPVKIERSVKGGERESDSQDRRVG